MTSLRNVWRNYDVTTYVHERAAYGATLLLLARLVGLARDKIRFGVPDVNNNKQQL